MHLFSLLHLPAKKFYICWGNIHLHTISIPVIGLEKKIVSTSYWGTKIKLKDLFLWTSIKSFEIATCEWIPYKKKNDVIAFSVPIPYYKDDCY